MRGMLKRKEKEEEKMLIRIPEFGEFLLERLPGGTLQAKHLLEGGKSERVCMLYERKPQAEHGSIRLRLERSAESGGLPHAGSMLVFFGYSGHDRKWKFEKQEGTIGRKITPAQWEDMLGDFLTDRNARKWLKDEEAYGPPKESFFQRHRLG